MLGASLVDPGTLFGQKGDPSQSLVASTEQFRDKYVFLAPQDYDINFVNIVAEGDTTGDLDGDTITASAFAAIGSSGYSVARLQLQPLGAHTLKTSKPAD